MKMIGKTLAILALTFAAGGIAEAQTANGRATTAAPTYTDGTPAPLSLDTAGNLRVNCVTGCDGGGGGGGGDVNINAVGGNPVTTDIPVSIDTLPAGTNEIGTVGVTSLPPLPAGGNLIGSVHVGSMEPLPAGGNVIGNVGVTTLPPLPTGSNSIGRVKVEFPRTFSSTWNINSNNNSFYGYHGATTLVALSASNKTKDPFFLKVYDHGSAPNCTGVTPVAVFIVPGGDAGGGTNIPLPYGMTMDNGVAFCITVNPQNGDNTPVPVQNAGSVNFTIVE